MTFIGNLEPLIEYFAFFDNSLTNNIPLTLESFFSFIQAIYLRICPIVP